jgi:hypothetical protein
VSVLFKDALLYRPAAPVYTFIDTTHRGDLQSPISILWLTQ